MKEVLSGYSAIGGIFEYLNSDCGYLQWSQYLIKKLAVLPKGSKGADVGCGNGYFTRAFSKAGYRVTGIDISDAALSAAVALARKEGISAEFLKGDITKLKLSGKVDFITAVNDCINYVPPAKLSRAFSCVAKNLRKGGMFLFDISSRDKLQNVVGDNIFVKDLEKATVIWYNTLAKDSVQMDITLFTLNPDGTYTRSDESQTQYIYDEETVVAELEKCNFAVRTEGDPEKGKEERINFICTKL